MVNDVLDYEPATVILLTGDGAGYEKGEGFHATLERMYKKEWKIELLSWENSTSNQMRKWVEEHGVFIPLDDFYQSITFLEPSKPGYPLELPRNAAPPNLSKRKNNLILLMLIFSSVCEFPHTIDQMILWKISKSLAHLLNSRTKQTCASNCSFPFATSRAAPNTCAFPSRPIWRELFWERVVNKVSILSPFRAVIIAVMRKSIS